MSRVEMFRPRRFVPPTKTTLNDYFSLIYGGRYEREKKNDENVVARESNRGPDAFFSRSELVHDEDLPRRRRVGSLFFSLSFSLPFFRRLYESLEAMIVLRNRM